MLAVILDLGTDGSAHNGDANNDTIVDLTDLTIIIEGWGGYGG